MVQPGRGAVEGVGPVEAIEAIEAAEPTRPPKPLRPTGPSRPSRPAVIETVEAVESAPSRRAMLWRQAMRWVWCDQYERAVEMAEPFEGGW